jgi:hypothetical protein
VASPTGAYSSAPRCGAASIDRPTPPCRQSAQGLSWPAAAAGLAQRYRGDCHSGRLTQCALRTHACAGSLAETTICSGTPTCRGDRTDEKADLARRPTWRGRASCFRDASFQAKVLRARVLQARVLQTKVLGQKSLRQASSCRQGNPTCVLTQLAVAGSLPCKTLKLWAEQRTRQVCAKYVGFA